MARLMMAGRSTRTSGAALHVLRRDTAARGPLVPVELLLPVLGEVDEAVEDRHPLVLTEGGAGFQVDDPRLRVLLQFESFRTGLG